MRGEVIDARFIAWIHEDVNVRAVIARRWNQADDAERHEANLHDGSGKPILLAGGVNCLCHEKNNNRSVGLCQ